MWELSKLMNRLRDGGVTIDNFIRGKLDIIEAHNLQINVKFQSSFLPGDVISSSGMTFARNDNDGNYPTPVELGLFTAQVVKNDVQLLWKTESESNNYGFEMLRNGQRISFVKGHGTTSEPQAYFYNDPGLSGGSYNYELIQIDFDGTRVKIGSTDINVLNNPTEFSLAQNYPNPFNVMTKIKYTVSERSFVSIKIYPCVVKK